MALRRSNFDARIALRAVGLRVTAPRVAVLDYLSTEPHSTVDAITRNVREQLGSVSTQAVYDVVSACVRAGLVRRIEFAGSAALYETQTNDNHHHLVCRVCGEVTDVECARGEAPCLEPSNAGGFLVNEAEIVFRGYCLQCRTATEPALQ